MWIYGKHLDEHSSHRTDYIADLKTDWTGYLLRVFWATNLTATDAFRPSEFAYLANPQLCRSSRSPNHVLRDLRLRIFVFANDHH